MSVRFTAEEIRAKYDVIAPNYDRMEGIAEHLGLARLRRRLLSNVKGAVLEVAVGTGKNLPHYPTGCQITAVDLSPGMLAIAKGRAEQLGLRVDLQIQNAEALTFADASFDTVLSTLSTCTFPNPVAALREMARVCRPGGRILLLEHGRSNREWLGRWQDRRADRHAMMVGCHWNRQPLEIVREAGLEVERAKRYLLGVVHVMEISPTKTAKPAPN